MLLACGAARPPADCHPAPSNSARTRQLGSQQPAASQQGRIVKLSTKFRETSYSTCWKHLQVLLYHRMRIWNTKMSASSCKCLGSAHLIKRHYYCWQWKLFTSVQVFLWFYKTFFGFFANFKLAGPLKKYDNITIWWKWHLSPCQTPTVQECIES